MSPVRRQSTFGERLAAPLGQLRARLQERVLLQRAVVARAACLLLGEELEAARLRARRLADPVLAVVEADVDLARLARLVELRQVLVGLLEARLGPLQELLLLGRVERRARDPRLDRRLLRLAVALERDEPLVRSVEAEVLPVEWADVLRLHVLVLPDRALLEVRDRLGRAAADPDHDALLLGDRAEGGDVGLREAPQLFQLGEVHELAGRHLLQRLVGDGLVADPLERPRQLRRDLDEPRPSSAIARSITNFDVPLAVAVPSARHAAGSFGFAYIASIRLM